MPWGYLTSLALSFIFSFALGIFTLLINPRSRVHQLLFLTTAGVSLWSAVALAILWLQPNASLGLLLSRILHVGVAMIALFFFHFVVNFLLHDRDYWPIVLAAYLVALLFVILFTTTRWLLTGMGPKAGFAVWWTVSPWYWFFIGYFVTCVVLATRLLYREFYRSDGIRRRQIFFLLLAVTVGFGGGVTNFFPQLFNLYPFGNYLVPLYPLLITYGIFLPKFEIRW